MKKQFKIIISIFIVIIIPLIYFVAYTYAVDLNNKAITNAIENNWENRESIEKSIDDINTSIMIFPWNSVFFTNKTMLQFRLGDYKALLLTNSKLIKLNPNKPLYIIQRGLIYELLNDSINAQKNYNIGLEKYKQITENKNDLQFQLEYIESIVISGKEEKTIGLYNRIKKSYPNNELLKYYELKTKKEVLELIKSKSLK